MKIDGEEYHAGKLIHQVDLESPPDPDTRNAAGQASGDYTPVCKKVWANVKPLAGRELIQAQKYTSLATERVVMRWRCDVEATWRLKFRGQALNVEYALDVEGRKQWLVCYCTRVAA